MIELDPAKRIYVKEAMKHPYFDDLNREDIVKYFPVGQEKLALQYGRWTIFNLIKIKYEYIYYIYNLAYKFYNQFIKLSTKIFPTIYFTRSYFFCIKNFS